VTAVRAIRSGRPVVLVHGAWHGAWCWARVEATLAGLGVTDIVAPTLTGLGERRAELAPTVGLQTHVDDVVALLDRLDGPVVLVGHSYAGLVVREAADRRPDAVTQLVLVDAWVGDDGASLLGLAPDWMVDYIRQAAAGLGDGWRVPPPDPSLVGVDDPDDAGWLRTNLTDQPLATFVESTILTGAAASIPTTAVVSEPSFLPFRQFAERAGWPVVSLRGGHDLMVTAPQSLARAIAAAAQANTPA
jgi:pimeloyl-ACP methyl ester carboxylesterase